MSERIKLFTDSDLDGVGCAVLASLAFENVSIRKIARAESKDEILIDFCKSSLQDFDKIFMTDISVSLETMNMLLKQYPTLEDKFLLFDHHPTAIQLNNLKCCTVREFKDETKSQKTCGTHLFKEYLVKNQFLSENNILVVELFTNMVRKYDTWEWKETNYEKSPNLNTLFGMYGFEEFLKIFLERLRDNTFYFTREEIFYIEQTKKSIEKYCERQALNLKKCNFFGHEGGYVFAEQHTSVLGNYLSEKFPNYKFILIINLNRNSCSLRTAQDFNCLEIAKGFGGGGHPKACGFSPSKIAYFIKDALLLE